MTLREARCRFSYLLGGLILYAATQGYNVAIDAVKDGPCRCGVSRHRRGSLHNDGLAVDLNLYRGGIYLRQTEDHARLGQYWKDLDENCRWGGDFEEKADGNHYSFAPRKLVGNRA